MSDCIFCKIVAGEIPCDKVYEDDNVLAFRDIAPKADTHILLIPKQHIENLSAVQVQQWPVVTGLLQNVNDIARQENLSDFRFITNNGAAGGQERRNR